MKFLALKSKVNVDEMPGEKAFAFFWFSALFAFATFFVYKQRIEIAVWLFAAALSLVILLLFFKGTLRSINYLAFLLSTVLGFFLSNFLLFVIYVSLVIPMAFLSKLAMNRPARSSGKKQIESTWIRIPSDNQDFDKLY